jgi:hypothetical protein
MLLEVVVPFLINGVITAKWGSTIQSYQVLELTIYETGELWDKRTGPLADLLRKRRNQFARFEAKAKKFLSKNVPRVFVVMPIQGEKQGTQEEQRIYREYDERFEVIEK